MPRRRAFLGTLLGGWVTAAVGGVVYPVLHFLNAPPMGQEQKQVTLTPDDLAEGEAIQIVRQGEPVIVIRTGADEFTTLSAVCTHLGCIVKWDAATRTLECPCHAARFDMAGNVLGGPPQSPLPAYPTTVEDGTIVIRTAA